LEGLYNAQRSDSDISYILKLMENSAEKPAWNLVACQSEDVRVLWGMWPRLQVWNGVLQRRFESMDGSSVTWQVILPKQMRREFLTIIHGGMTGGHLARKRTAASIQATAYWPTWSSDLDAFLRECQLCVQYHRGSAPKKAHLMTPNKLFLGHEVHMPIDVVMGLPPDDGQAASTPDDYLDKLKNDATNAYRLAREKLRASAERRKRQYDLKVKPKQFGIGDWVYYHYPRKFQSKSAKWQKSYTGPYLIVRMIEPVNCVLQRSAKAKPFVVHINKLKNCYGPTPTSWLTSESQ